MASSRNHDDHDDGFSLCTETLVEVATLNKGISSYLDKKTSFTPTDIQQVSKAAGELLGAVKGQLPVLTNNLKTLTDKLATEKSRKVDKELRNMQAELVSKLKIACTKTEDSVKGLESLYAKIEKEYTSLNKRLIKDLAHTSPGMFATKPSSGKQEISPPKSHPSKTGSAR